jgi:type II secretory pathway component PulJ
VTARGARAGFTLIEVLGVMLLTSLVFSVALQFYVDLSNQSLHATETMRDWRRATAVLDRVANDLEHAVLVSKPEETDPLAHPWLFLAESRHSTVGADRVKFMRRRAPARDDGPASDVLTVSYVLQPSLEEEDRYELRRWSAAGLPEGLDRDFPLEDDPELLLVADGLVDFGLQLNGAGGPSDVWDSSQVVNSGDLPFAIDILVALDEGGDGMEPLVLSRRVRLPVRPLDLEVLLDPATYGAAAGGADGEESDELCDGYTIASCVDLSQIGSFPGLSPENVAALEGMVDSADETCFDVVRDLVPAGHPAVDPSCL